MKIDKTQLFRTFGLLAAGIMLSLVATASWAKDKHDDDRDYRSERHHPGKSQACFMTTDLMREACGADVVDDYLTESAICLNTDDPRGCQREVRAEFRNMRKNCRYEARGRNDLCRRLPDAGPYITDIDPEDFTGECVDGNPWFPLVVGDVATFVNEEDEGETIIVEVLDEIREIQGIETIVVRDTVYEGLPDENNEPTGDVIEDTDDYYAVANNCDVWYLGEVSQNFEDGYLDNLDGSFIADVEGAQAGIIMLADPQVGDVYRQEFALGEAEDAAEVLALETDIWDEDGELVTFDDPAWDCEGKCLKTEDFIANDPDGTEFKYFKKGIGFVAEQLPEGEVVLKRVK